MGYFCDVIEVGGVGEVVVVLGDVPGMCEGLSVKSIGGGEEGVVHGCMRVWR